MSVCVRFAPSPTGLLHVGNIYIALNNWLFARKRGGRFVLRLDDTDVERSTPEFARGIEADLHWLGLDWDALVRQTDRIQRYEAAARRLKDIGRLYPCYETAEELDLRRKLQRSQGRPPVYDRAALKLTAGERAELEAKGIRPHWRFLLQPGRIEWTDLVRGPEQIDASSQSDPVLMRADGTFLYTLPSVVDDIELGITHVIRGSDHVTNTATQVQVFAALGAAPPEFAHLPLLVNAAGEGLSKRTGALSVAELREAGMEPVAINAYLANIGTGETLRPVRQVGDLLPAHDLAAFGRSSPRFDQAELRHLNARLVHLLPFDEARPHLESVGLGRVDPALWDVARANVGKLEDVGEWLRICRDGIDPVPFDREYAARAADLLPGEPWDTGTWKAWTDALKAETGRTGKNLFMPLRQALTGREDGPELRLLLPLIGRERALRRLRGGRD